MNSSGKEPANESDRDQPLRQEHDAPTKKRQYRAPRLSKYGSLRHLALGVGGKKADGGSAPKSRV